MDRARITIIAVILAIIFGIIILIYAAITLFGGSDDVMPNVENAAEVSSVQTQEVIQNGITVATTTTLYVDPKLVKRPQDENMTPVAPTPAQSSSNRGSFFSYLFSGAPQTLPAGYTQADLSSQYRAVRIASVRTKQSGSPDNIVMNENIGGNDAPVIVTGWTLKSNRDSFVIPRAAKVYDTAGSPLEVIKIGNGQSMGVYSSASPLGANFMLNKCVGYLSRSYNFSPLLPGNCQRPQKSEIATFTGTCQDYIINLPDCTEGNPNDARIPASDSSCKSFVSSINYSGCVAKYRNQTDFLTGNWAVWAGRSFIDPLHDQILLLDGSGKLVDWYVY